MVYFSLLRSTHKNSILYYKAVKVTINASNLTKVIFDGVVYRHNLPDWLLPKKIIFNRFICHHGLLDFVVTSSNALYPLKTCHCLDIFQILDKAILLHFMCKLAALLKGQITFSRAYL